MNSETSYRVDTGNPKDPNLSLRKGPNAAAEKIVDIPEGRTFKAMKGQSGVWVYGTYNAEGKSYTGYVNSRYLKEIPAPTPSSAPSSAPSQTLSLPAYARNWQRESIATPKDLIDAGLMRGGPATFDAHALYRPVENGFSIRDGKNFIGGFAARGEEAVGDKKTGGLAFIRAMAGGRATALGHQGMDWYASYGDTISAPGAGTIIDPGTNHPGLGRTVIMHYSDVKQKTASGEVNVYGLFAHTKTPEGQQATLRAGQTVRTGEPIANVGTTGYVGTAPQPGRPDFDFKGWPHVHTELRIPKINSDTGKRFSAREVEADMGKFYARTEAIDPLTQSYSRMDMSAAKAAALAAPAARTTTPPIKTTPENTPPAQPGISRYWNRLWSN